jgi:SNF2 family DNA or RNA helicase
LLVGYEFKHEVESIHKVLGKHIPNIGGGISAKSAAVLIDAWNRKEIPVLLAQSSSLAHGVNLQAGGHHLCWFTPTYNLETYEQFIARIYRQGQPEHVFIYHIVAKGTIDYAVMAAVNKKDNTQQSFLAALGNYWPK